MSAMEAEEEWGRIDGRQGETGKVIKNSSCRCFCSTSKWRACQRQRLGLMHYWAGAHLAPSHPPGWQSGSRPSALTQPPVWRRPAGDTEHMLDMILKGGKTGTFAVCKPREKNACFRSSVNISKRFLHLHSVVAFFDLEETVQLSFLNITLWKKKHLATCRNIQFN